MPGLNDLGNIKEILEAEAGFAEQTPPILAPFAPQLLQAVNDAMGMYVTFGRIIGQYSPMAGYSDEVAAYAKELGAKDDVELHALRDVRPGDSPEREVLLQRVDKVMLLAEAHMVRGIAFTQIARAFAWSAADLMRMRLTTALGLQRQVVEGLALLCLMRDDPWVAIEWRSVLTDQQGRRFFDKYQRSVSRELTKLGLRAIYDTASGHSLHLRFAGAAAGLQFRSREDGSGRRQSSTMMLFQELRPDTAFGFIVNVVRILDTQATVFSQLTTAFPTATEDVWMYSRVPTFRKTVAALWKRFKTAFPDDVARIEAMRTLGL